jgi:beta-lactamase regulating signal transducer with metallopeptidase domain
MWVGLDRLGHLLLDASLATTIFLSLAVVLMLACHQPARRIVVAQSAILLAILMIPLVAVSPLPLLEPLALSVAEWAHRPGLGPWWADPWPLRVATIGYLGGAALGLCWIAIGLLGIRRLSLDSAEPSPETAALYLELVRSLGGRAAIPDLRVSPRLRRPVLTGLPRPFILIPTELDHPEFDRDELRLVLIHELVHADRSDLLFGAAASLAQGLWFFLPHAWWLRRQVRMDQEFVADRETVELVGSSAAYATRLVAMAARIQGVPSLEPISHSVPLLSGWWWDGGFKTPLLQRVVMLLHAPFRTETRPSRRWSTITPAALLGLAILSSTIRFPTPPTSPPGPSMVRPSNVFRVGHFVASPRGATNGGRTLPYTLPLALPPEFELSVEIEASASSLARMWIAGYPLAGTRVGVSIPPPKPDLADHSVSLHQVLLRRFGRDVRLLVDGRSVAVTRTDDSSSDWLTIEPAPEETATLRNLVVRW